MTRLIRYEFYKLFCKRSILVVLILFSVINLFKINNEFHSYSYLADGKDSRSWNSVYWQLYEITTDKINNLLDLYQPLVDATADMTASTDTDDPNTMTGNIYSDENILEKYYVQPMEYFYNYRTYASEVAKKAKENAAFYKEQGLNFEVRKNSVIYNLYSGRNIPAFAYQDWFCFFVYTELSALSSMKRKRRWICCY